MIDAAACPNLLPEGRNTAGISTWHLNTKWIPLTDIPLRLYLGVPLLYVTIHAAQSIILCVSQLKDRNLLRKDCLEACNNGSRLRNSSMCQKEAERELMWGLHKCQGYLSLYCIQSQWACAEGLRHWACAVKLSVCQQPWHRGQKRAGRAFDHLDTGTCVVSTETIKEDSDWKVHW